MTPILPPPPLRQNNQPDSGDSDRVRYCTRKWHDQDSVRWAMERQIEENIRMLAGQQWWVFHQTLGRFVDVTEWMTDEEKRWRVRPVLNRLLQWFMITHARLTENPPIVGFLPGPDRIDADLAEVMDILFKTLWREADMTEVFDQLMAWLIPGGHAYLQSRIDGSRGPWQPWTGQAEMPIVGPDGKPMLDETGLPFTTTHDEVPFDQHGTPQAQGVHVETGELVGAGEPHAERSGQIVVDVLSPLQVRGEWGARPWHEKSWHQTSVFWTPDEVQDLFGVTVEPDPATGTGMGELDRILFGPGYFGAASKGGLMGQGADSTARDGFVRGYVLWERPCPRYPETPQSPGGRLLITTASQVLFDGARPVAFPHTSPIRCYQFVRLPGRPAGTSPQEFLNAPQRAYNRLTAQGLEHAHKTGNPLTLIDSGSGLDETAVTDKPGAQYVVTMRPGVDAVKHVPPPPLGADVYRMRDILGQEIEALGNTNPGPDEGQSRDASGELIKELRFDKDRHLGPTVRRAVEETARLVQDWMVLLPRIYTWDQIIAYTGEDNIARTTMVRPLLFQEGKVNVVPDVESMLPEGRGERQSRVAWMYQNGLFGLPGSPQAIGRFFELGRFPHLSRTAKPGGVNRTTAEQNLGKLLQGIPAAQIPVFEWYQHDVHLDVLETFMSSPEFLKLDPAIQGEAALLRQALKEARLRALFQQQMDAATVAPPAPQGPGGPPPAGMDEPDGAGLSAEPAAASRPTPGQPQPVSA